jgi:Uma2 family endonuclease
MPTTTPTTRPAAPPPTAPAEAARWHQAHWNALARDPALRDLPYKIETNARGQLLLSPPPKNHHTKQQRALQKLLTRLLPQGENYVEYAIATPAGTRVPDVVWMSAEREAKMDATGDPTTLAPEICVEVMSPTNTEAEMMEKAALYLRCGAEEIWIVDADGGIRVFVAGDDGTPQEAEASQIAPDAPTRISP